MANPDLRPRKPGPRPGVCDREQPPVHGGYPGDFPLDRGREMAGQSRTFPVAVPWVDAPHGRGHSRRTLRPAEGRARAAAMRPIPAPWLLHRLLPRRHAVTRRAGLAFQRRTVPGGHSGESPDTPAGGGGLRRRPAEEFLDLRREPRCATPRPQGRVRRWLGHEAECGAAGRSSASNRRRVGPAARGARVLRLSDAPRTWRLQGLRPCGVVLLLRATTPLRSWFPVAPNLAVRALAGTAFFTLIAPVARTVFVPRLLLPARQTESLRHDCFGTQRHWQRKELATRPLRDSIGETLWSHRPLPPIPLSTMSPRSLPSLARSSARPRSSA